MRLRLRLQVTAKLMSIPDLSPTFLTKSNSLPGISLDVSPTSQNEHIQRQIYPLPPAYKIHSSSWLSCLVVEGRNLGVIQNSFLLMPSPKVIKVCPFCLLSLERFSSFLISIVIVLVQSFIVFCLNNFSCLLTYFSVFLLPFLQSILHPAAWVIFYNTV